MSRRGRWKFGPLTKPPRWKKFFAFDTETRRMPFGGSEFVLGTLFDGDTMHVFRNRKRMIKEILKRKFCGWTGWASNLEYDLNTLFPESDWPVFYNYFGGILKGAKLKTRHRPRKKGRKSDEWVYFADTLNHWPGGVDQYGKLVGLDKLEMPDIVPGDELATYCMRDTEIVYRMVERAQMQYNEMGCELKSSVAASAMDLYRRQYMDDAWSFWPLHGHIRDVFKESYSGARTENFAKGTFRDIYMADVVSMYPAIMRSLLAPVLGSMRRRSTRIVDELEGVACVEVEVPEDSYYPPLPFRFDKLYFPTGKWTAVFPLNELRYAEQHGVKINRVHFAYQFDKSEYVFRDYVDSLFPMKQNAKSALEEKVIKLFLNSLYGKFATGGEAREICPNWYDGTELEEDEVLEQVGEYHVRKSHSIPAYSNYIWSSYVTGGSRFGLHGHLVRYNGIYCDTDSVATREKIERNKELGGLDLKYFTEEMEILGPKMYRDKENVKMKGVPKSAVALFHEKTKDGMKSFSTMLKDSPRLAHEYLFERVTRLRESIRRGIPKNDWHWVEKVLRLEGEKRQFNKDGTSRPLTVAEIRGRRFSPMIRRRLDPTFRIREIRQSRAKSA